MNGSRELSAHAGELFDLGDDAVEFIDQIRVIAMLAERGQQRPVIPKRAIFLTRKAVENLRPVPSQFGQDRARVMQFIGR